MGKQQNIEVPKNHFERINWAIKQGMGTDKWKVTKLLHGGFSGAYTYLLSIDEKSYVVKLEKLDAQEVDFERCCEVIQLASEQGFCPKVYFLDADKGVVIMEFIDSKPLPLLEDKYVRQFAHLVQQYHYSQTIPEWIGIFDILYHFYQKLSEDYKQSELMQNCLQEIKNMKSELSDPSDIRPSHCDLNPYNVLFDQEKIYLIDWLAASPQNFYFDLACCQVFFYHSSPKLMELFLLEYFGRVPNSEERHKFNLMCRFSFIYYGVVFLQLSMRTDSSLDLLDEKATDLLPSYSTFMQSIGQGKVNLADAHAQQQLGYVMLLSGKNYATG